MLRLLVVKVPKRPWYDNKQGITASLVSLKRFLNLIRARSEAGYDRGERLNEFLVLGRYFLDTCGNCSKATDWVPKDKLPNIPNVLTRDEFWAYIKDNVPNFRNLSMPFRMGSDLPNKNVVCPVCKRTWHIGNCYDTVVWHKTEVFPLGEFVGKTLGVVKAIYASRTNGIYRMQPDCLIRNDRFIDLSPKYPGETEEWKQGIVRNEGGWVSKEDGIGNDYVIQTGDEGFFNVWTYYHRGCNRLQLALNEERRFREVFQKAGFRYLVFEHLPNQYCPCERCAPWFKVITEVGTFLIGWRKRVINIDWSGIPNFSDSAFVALFKNEEVTKSPTSIHAWGWDKATDYLTRIHNLLAA